MAASSVRAVFSARVQKVWDVVTSQTDYQWRSDVSRIESLSATRFVEYSKDGFATTFTVTCFQPYRRWEFDLENSNMKGHWTGIFTEMDGQTQVCLTEEVTAKRLLLRPLVKPFLRRQQARYLADLAKALQ